MEEEGDTQQGGVPPPTIDLASCMGNVTPASLVCSSALFACQTISTLVRIHLLCGWWGGDGELLCVRVCAWVSVCVCVCVCACVCVMVGWVLWGQRLFGSVLPLSSELVHPGPPPYSALIPLL
eukprot:TRINITY_DN2098_c0_g2_i1.p2 TRINITY_DN2098_c0_g2~~TRINITY_DN2098_c0_g2_i1.p2  ORF type:complete len:123 (+),score=21.40 TRINITY_DN2098_c0_g2_i1:402-770(+)